MGSERTSSSKGNEFQNGFGFGGFKSHLKFLLNLPNIGKIHFHSTFSVPKYSLHSRDSKENNLHFGCGGVAHPHPHFSHRSDFEDGFFIAFESGNPNKLINFLLTQIRN